MKILTFPVGSFGTNCLIVTDEESGECAIVDPGAEAKKIKGKIENKGLYPSVILLTHGHFDHIMAVEELRRDYNIPLYIHRDDEEMILDPEKSCMRLFAGKSEPLSPADRLLEDGDRVKVGTLEIEIMHTPGHTRGSVCFICEGNVFCGDTIFRGSIGRYDLYGGDYDAILHSVEKLKALPDDFKLFPGHGSTSTIGREKTYNLYFQ